MFGGIEILGGVIYLVVKDIAKVVFNLKDKNKKENKEKMRDYNLNERFNVLENKLSELNGDLDVKK